MSQSTRPNIPVHPLLDLLPESVIQLQIEIQKHHLWMFQKHSNLASLWGTPEMIGIAAAEVGVLLDGDFNEEGIDKICEVIRSKLVASRTSKVNPMLILPPSRSEN
jgi:hypothetical protein